MSGKLPPTSEINRPRLESRGPERRCDFSGRRIARPNNLQFVRPLLGALLCAFLAAAIVTSLATVADARPADSVSVLHCTFGDEWDEDFDGWPDRWSRTTGLEYPHYVQIAIQDDATAANKRCLQFKLDGAAAAVSSPPIRVLSRFSYLFEAMLKTEGLKQSVVIVTLDFCDQTGHVILSESSKPISATKGWQRIALGPLVPGDASIDHAVVRINISRGSRGDLQGRVSVADVWMARLPRIAVSTDNPCNVFTDLNSVVVKCELSGIRESDPEIRFRLFDAFNREQDTANFKLNGRPIFDQHPSTSRAKDGSSDAQNGFEGSEKWQPKIPDYGFYRVAVRMLSSESSGGQNEEGRQLGDGTVWLAVVPPLEMPRQGEFGWTLPNGDMPLPFQELSRLLPLVGINWVKLPVWFDSNNPRRGDELIRFVELLGATNIEAVGVIDCPPTTTDLAHRLDHNVPIADLLLDSTSPWLAALEPVMTRLSLRVRWWQLGRDRDTSFAGVPELVKRIDELRTELFRFGQDVRLGINWDWEAGNEIAGNVSWDFEQLCVTPQPPEEKLDELLSTPRNNSALHWIVIEPPPRAGGVSPFDQAAQAMCMRTDCMHIGHLVAMAGLSADVMQCCRRSARASEFVRRLVTAKVRGAKHIIVPDPFDDERGLMHANGMPGELLLPWRTTAAMLGGAEYLGQMTLPGGSENRIFLRPDGQLVMAAWNRVPTHEMLFLGKDVRHIDLEGRTTVPVVEGEQQIIKLGPKPAFVLGLHEAITRWRMATAFDRIGVPSIFAKPHANSLKFKNFFPQGVGGSMRIVVPEEQPIDERIGVSNEPKEAKGLVPYRWTIEPPHGTFALAAGEDANFPFIVRLKNAYFGKQPIRVDFRIQADEPYAFSVYTELQVGTDDLTLDVRTHLDKDGILIVEQLMTNRAKRLADFRCYLYPKEGRRPQRAQVYRLGSAVDRKIYRIPAAHDLIGREMLLEIEELNGPRVLKYRFIATNGSAENTKTSERNEETPAEDNSDVSP